MMIAFAGLDGSGKTLQAKALADTLCRSGVEVYYVWSRWSPFFLKPFISLGRLIFNTKSSSEDEQYRSFRQGKRRLFQRPLVAGLWKNLALLDYYFQILFKVKLRSRRARVTICDRYITDLLVDLGNNFGYSREEVGKLLNSWLLAVYPKPEYSFLLDLPAEVAFKRKEDVPLSYLQDRRALYLAFGKCQGAEILDATASIEDLKQIIHRKTMRFLGGS